MEKKWKEVDKAYKKHIKEEHVEEINSFTTAIKYFTPLF